MISLGRKLQGYTVTFHYLSPGGATEDVATNFGRTSEILSPLRGSRIKGRYSNLGLTPQAMYISPLRGLAHQFLGLEGTGLRRCAGAG